MDGSLLKIRRRETTMIPSKSRSQRQTYNASSLVDRFETPRPKRIKQTGFRFHEKSRKVLWRGIKEQPRDGRQLPIIFGGKKRRKKKKETSHAGLPSFAGGNRRGQKGGEKKRESNVLVRNSDENFGTEPLDSSWTKIMQMAAKILLHHQITKGREVGKTKGKGVI